MQKVLWQSAALTILASITPLRAQAKQSPPALRWVDANSLTVEGRAWTELEAPFDRLPAKAKKLVRKRVWQLSQDSAGICVRFRSNARSLSLRWTLRRKALAMPHMPATGVSGVDLYVRYKGQWRWLANAKPSKFPDNTARLFRGLDGQLRDYLLYLPLYNGVTAVELGLANSAKIEPLARKPSRKPIVFYGTSITQGGCASRPGMPHPAILGRRLDRPVINLGFSGNGRLELELAKLLAEIDAAVYVLDCLPNLNGKQITARMQPFVEALRKARPRTPILLVEDRSYADAFLISARRARNAGNRKASRAAFAKLRAAGIQGLFYLRGEKLLSENGEDTVDGSHPTDLGFVHQAQAMEAVLRRALKD